MDLSALKGVSVKHITLGLGIITDVKNENTGKYIEVHFKNNKKSMPFAYPDAFEKYLIAGEYCDEISGDVKAKKKEIKLAEEKQRLEEEKTKKHAEQQLLKNTKTGTAEVKNIKRRSIIKEGDTFNRINDIFSECFGTTAPPRHCYIKVDEKYRVWCPKLAIYKAGGFRAADKKYGCINIIEQNGDVILEGNENPAVAEKDYGPYSEKRAVFMHKEDGLYHFLGVYEYGGFDKARKSRIHKRIAKTLDLSAWN